MTIPQRLVLDAGLRCALFHAADPDHAAWRSLKRAFGARAPVWTLNYRDLGVFGELPFWAG
ncbi:MULTISPECIES: hypothetical protein [unclassified Meiothermus]|uniref:hypothetical protein n=1 Tax=unclassified Meiothermus TaxID=370471 RepID=UPI000D7C52DE|nr:MULTISPECIES: hypothetical protein [unclassified Meiothermus]PZA05822.1 hypothetical protein DNA98_16830 [Meiothermus sp. Pnk-1]RYM27519.1 hypothetical protein EWH23_16500 [Meiothermus sp. PNK-Is4]